MQMDSVEDIYDFLTGMQPDTVFAKRIWEGLANAYYYDMNNNPYYYNKEKLDFILELAQKYNLSIPSDEMQKTIKLTKNSIENLENVDLNTKNDFDYEFTGTASGARSENL